MIVFCSECEYWLQEESLPEIGQCRRKAPIPDKIGGTTFNSPHTNRVYWPYARINDGCGEGALKRDKQIRVPESTKKQETILDTLPKINAFDMAVNKARKSVEKKNG